MPVPRKKNVQTRSQNLATTSETIVDPGKKRKLVSTSEDGSDVENPSIEQGKTKLSRQATASTSTKKTSKRQSRASKDEEEEDDDEEDLGGFLVDNVEEEDEEVIIAVHLLFFFFFIFIFILFLMIKFNCLIWSVMFFPYATRWGFAQY